MSEFRDQDRSELAAFTTHVSIAESLLDVIADTSARLHAVRSGHLSAELLEQRREAWGNLWTQLDDARRIAASLGRNLAGFDGARARVGNVHLAAAGMERIERPMLDATAEAIDALRATIPEVVIPRSQDSQSRNPVRYVPARSFSNPAYRRIFWIWVVLIVGLIVAFRFV